MSLLDFIRRKKEPAPPAAMQGEELTLNPDTVKRQRRSVRRLWRLKKAIDQANPGAYRDALTREWARRVQLLKINGVDVPEKDPQFTTFVRHFRRIAKQLHEGKK